MRADDTMLRSPARRDAEAGFTLIEMLIVVAVIAILLAVAVPAYFGFSDRAELSVAQSNVRAIIPAVEQFHSDNETYVGLDNAATAATPGLAYYDRAGADKVMVSGSPGLSANNYCVYSTMGTSTWFKHGPGGDITKDPGPVRTDCDAST